MGCERIVLPDGTVMIVCSRRKYPPCSVCGAPSQYQCDYPTGPGETCDAYLCARHAWTRKRGVHYCPEHEAAYRAAVASVPADMGGVTR